MSLRTPLVAPVIAVLAVVLTGCGGGSKPATATTTTTTAAGAPGGANRAALAAFRACMAKNGSPLPTFAPRANNGTPPSSLPDNAAAPDNGGAPGAGGGAGRGFGGGIGNVATSTDPAVQKAFAACKSTLPAGFLQQQQQRSAFNSCMKDHGVTLPSGAPTPGETTTTIDRNSPAYTAAFAVCGQLLPQRPNRTTTTTTAAQ